LLEAAGCALDPNYHLGIPSVQSEHASLVYAACFEESCAWLLD
jgi:hypothetical protein